LARLPPESDPAASPPADLVELGVLRGAYGVKGWVRVQPHSAQATALRASRSWWLLGPTGRVDVAAVRRQGAALVAKLRGIDSPEQADRLRGVPVGIARADFPPPGEGEVYWIDLIGARVVNRDGRELGRVGEVLSSGAQELLQVRDGERAFLVPLVPHFIDEVDLAQGTVRVDWEADW
jgi:16S rRNA processing protein RimM